MNKTLLINSDKCTGCRLCELACSFYHTGVFKPSASRIKVKIDTKEGIATPMVCEQCEDYPCIAVCPVFAIRRDIKTGVVKINKAKCVGCRECEFACEYGAISYEEDSKEIIVCDRCRGEPKCVELCFPGAIEWI